MAVNVVKCCNEKLPWRVLGSKVANITLRIVVVSILAVRGGMRDSILQIRIKRYLSPISSNNSVFNDPSYYSVGADES